MAAKAKTEKKSYLGISGLTAKKLNSIAEELNTALGITPAIDVENLEDEDLLASVKTTMEVDVYSNDDLSDDVWALMKELGVEPKEPEDGETGDSSDEEEEEEKPAKKGAKAAPKEEKKPAGKGKSKPKDEEPEDEPEEGNNDEEEEKPAPKSKGKDKKEEKKPAKTAPKAKEEKKPAKAAPKEKESRYTRMDAFATALLEGKKDKKTAEAVFSRADELYVENTGKDSNLRESAWACKHALNALASCGYIEFDGTSITILARPA